MLDPAVKVDNVRTATGFDPGTLLPSSHVQITYHVGDHGPFVHTTPAANFNQQYLEKVTGETANTLRGAGVIKTPTGS